MPQVTRRRFVQGSAVAIGGGVVATKFLFGPLETLASAGTTAQAGPVEDVIATTCWIGKQDCGMLARRIDGRVVKFEGNPTNPRNVGTLCPKGQAQIQARPGILGNRGSCRRRCCNDQADSAGETRESDPVIHGKVSFPECCQIMPVGLTGCHPRRWCGLARSSPTSSRENSAVRGGADGSWQLGRP